MHQRHVIFQAVELDVDVAREDNALHGPVGAIFLMRDEISKTASEMASCRVILTRHRKLQTQLKISTNVDRIRSIRTE